MPDKKLKETVKQDELIIKVWQLHLEGKKNKDIAAQLNISISKVSYCKRKYQHLKMKADGNEGYLKGVEILYGK